MVMHVDVFGQEVETRRVTVIDDEAIERTKDLLCLRLARAGMTYRQLARLFNTSPASICRRLREIPPHARSYYEKHPLVGLA